MPILKANGTELYYESHGQGPALVFAHGVGGNHAIWFNQLAAFQHDYRVITFDHRGFGNSPDPQGLGRSAYTDDLSAVLDHLEVESCCLVGQSMGGGTCLGYAKMYPQRVNALVLADTLHGFILPEEAERIMQKARSETGELGQIERVLGKRAREADPAKAVLYQQLNSFNATNRYSLRGSYPHTLSPHELGALGIPVLFIAGEEDILFPVAAIKRVQQQVADSEWVEMPGAGHSAFYEQPDVFNRHIGDFLSRNS
jgi:pimeloyl-ACP methyl ester carboxylesterase